MSNLTTLSRPSGFEENRADAQGDRRLTVQSDLFIPKPPYSIDQQVEFLSLQAEVETLLLQLQSLQRQS
ncbi:MAG: hypothetical protein HC825_01845 [Oscillatoriales cyanobacterium RM1_1_9]|nr:hypothetical protein [Oscillatoriales cyanobacterium SM2_3_0]NJO47213.1 hypothetical protein [Oscillatoriales cyanobacterium RM2_1_1]NJO70784.1 hypothetical protein [Oscillatoriales cyanobacterium RM1_1_9]